MFFESYRVIKWQTSSRSSWTLQQPWITQTKSFSAVQRTVQMVMVAKSSQSCSGLAAGHYESTTNHWSTGKKYASSWGSKQIVFYSAIWNKHKHRGNHLIIHHNNRRLDWSQEQHQNITLVTEPTSRLIIRNLKACLFLHLLAVCPQRDTLAFWKCSPEWIDLNTRLKRRVKKWRYSKQCVF